MYGSFPGSARREPAGQSVASGLGHVALEPRHPPLGLGQLAARRPGAPAGVLGALSGRFRSFTRAGEGLLGPLQRALGGAGFAPQRGLLGARGLEDASMLAAPALPRRA